MRAWAPGSLMPSMPIRGGCATRSSGAGGSIRPAPLKPGRPLVAVSSAAVPGTTIQTTSAPRTATGTPPITGTTTWVSALAVRFPPEPARSRSRRACAERPGPSMMSMVGVRVRWRSIPRWRLCWLARGRRSPPAIPYLKHGWRPCSGARPVTQQVCVGLRADAPTELLLIKRQNCLTTSLTQLQTTNLAHQGTPFARVLPKSGASAVPAGGRYGPHPGSFGHHLTGTMTGPGGAFSGLGLAGAGNARLEAGGLRAPVGAALQDRTSRLVPRKPGLKLRPRAERPNGKSRGGTPTGERVPLDARRARWRGGWTMRLSAFRLSSFFLRSPDGAKRILGGLRSFTVGPRIARSLHNGLSAPCKNSGANASREGKLLTIARRTPCPRKLRRGRARL